MQGAASNGCDLILPVPLGSHAASTWLITTNKVINHCVGRHVWLRRKRVHTVHTVHRYRRESDFVRVYTLGFTFFVSPEVSFFFVGVFVSGLR